MRLSLLAGNNAIDPLSLLCLKAVGILCMKENVGVGPHSILCSSGSLSFPGRLSLGIDHFPSFPRFNESWPRSSTNILSGFLFISSFHNCIHAVML